MALDQMLIDYVLLEDRRLDKRLYCHLVDHTRITPGILKNQLHCSVSEKLCRSVNTLQVVVDVSPRILYRERLQRLAVSDPLAERQVPRLLQVSLEHLGSTEHN